MDMPKLVKELYYRDIKRLSPILRSFLLVGAVIVVSSSAAMGATITSNQTGNWSTGTTWIGGVPPVAGDNAVIAAGHTVTLTANTAITGLTVNGTGILATGANTLGVSGSL